MIRMIIMIIMILMIIMITMPHRAHPDRHPRHDIDGKTVLLRMSAPRIILWQAYTQLWMQGETDEWNPTPSGVGQMVNYVDPGGRNIRLDNMMRFTLDRPGVHTCLATACSGQTTKAYLGQFLGFWLA